MRKNATKIAAMMLSLALTVTSVNVPTTSSAATKVKLNKTKATLYVGGASSKKTTTLKATYKGKKVKATFTSSNAKVAKVAKSTGKVTAVKKGTATITAKYSGKKATCKVTVKQYVTSITAPATIDLKVGELVDLSKQVTVKPAGANNKALSYVSDESFTAAVNGSGTILKGVKEGITAVKIKAKDGSGKTAQVTVNVKPADASETPAPGETPGPSSDKEAKEIKMGIENPFSTEEKYANTLLVGTNAYVTVQLVDEDGKPVANQEVELTSKKVYPTGAANDYIKMFGNVSESVKKTDSKGNVTFVYGLDKSTDTVQGKVIDATRTEFVSSFKLTASVVGNKELTKSVDVKFASLSNAAASSGIYVRNGVANSGIAALVKGVNAATPTANTKGRNEENITYVTSQQVSPKDSDSHKVVFDSGVGSLNLTMPGSETTGSEAERVKETINWSTDKYMTYASEQKNTSGGWVLKSVKASDLQYATVTFDKLRLSKYSQFLVRAYIVTNKDNPTAGAPNVITPITLKPEESNIGGPKAEDNFSVQIPVSAKSGYLYVTAQIVSKGQVNTDLNEGFTIRCIEGVKKPGSTSVTSIGSESIQGLEVEWKVDDNATYTINQPLTAATAPATYTKLTALGYTTANNANSFWYKVPAFPATGNAIITVRDSAGNDIAYYAVPTVNASEVVGATTVYKNQNVIVDDATADFYQISKEEATRLSVGTVTQSGNDAVVNSYESGVTHIVGTIKSTNANIKIDESNSRIYTSVHWNPVQNTTSTGPTATGIAAAALVGQNLVLRAQLTDKNGNVVSTNGVPIKFYKNKANNEATDEIKTTDTTVGEASLVKVDASTNALGQAELVLSSGKPAQTLDIVAKAGDDKFDITYQVGTQTVSGGWVDLYWVDANLYFEPGKDGGATVTTTLDTPVKETKGSGTDIVPTVGQNWAYEVRTSGQTRDGGNGGTLTAFDIVEISGLTIQTSVDTGSVGSVTNANNGKAEATSTKAGYTDIVNELNNASITKDVTLTFKKANGDSKVVPYAGEGNATLSKKLTLNVNWNASAPAVDFIIPTGRQADVNGGNVKTYVVVKDANGNPIKNKVVTLKVTGYGSVITPTATTNDEGIAGFEVSTAASLAPVTSTATAGQSSTLVATVDGLTSIAQSSIKWINPVGQFKVTRADYDYNAKTIKLTFNNAVSADSVVKEVFKVEYIPAGGTVAEQIVSEIKVSGKEVTISVPALTNLDLSGQFKVTVRSYTDTKTTIEYNLVSTDAQKLGSGAGLDVLTFTAAGADF